jgi:starch phosphorylase
MDSDGVVSDTFYVTGDDGIRVEDPYDLANIEQVVTFVMNAHYLKSSEVSRPTDKTANIDNPRKKDMLYSLMDSYIKNDVLAVQKSIVNHVEYTLARSRYRFDDFEAYQVR